MFRSLATLALIAAFLRVAPPANSAPDEQQSSSQPVNAVIEWNRTLLAIVRTPGAQPVTIHSTRNFAILHAGNIQDFWNEIAQTAALAHQLNLEHSARLFALLNISLADATIAFFEAKYSTTFGVQLLPCNWRILTEIRRPTRIQHGFH